jgi:hypothetical protein
MSECASVTGHFNGHAEALKWSGNYYRHGDNQQHKDAKCSLFAGHFAGHRDAAVLYHAHGLMEEVRGFHKNH